jgi:hypothetical protein
MTMPEGFNARDDGTFHGIPAWCMSEANSIASLFINKRPWDVPCLADAIFQSYKKGLNEGSNMTDKVRTLLHITAGNDSWTPTEAELQDIAARFTKGLNVDDGKIGLVATRDCVEFTTTFVQGAEVVNVAAVRAPAPIPENLRAGRKWTHPKTGNEYEVLIVSNERSTKPDFVPTVVYRDEAGAIWSRPVSEFLEKFTFEPQ